MLTNTGIPLPDVLIPSKTINCEMKVFCGAVGSLYQFYIRVLLYNNGFSVYYINNYKILFKDNGMHIELNLVKEPIAFEVKAI